MKMIAIKFRSRHGQVLSEYGVAIALVGLVAIGGLLFFQDQVEGIWSGISFGKTNTIAVANSTSGGGNSATGKAGNILNGTGNGTGTKITLSDGTKLDLGSYPGSLSKAVETTGVNGTTDMLLGSLESIADSLQDQGKLTPEQISMFANLANLGHKISDIEKTVDRIGQQCNDDRACFNYNTVSYEGVMYKNAWELLGQNIGKHEADGDPNFWPANSLSGKAMSDSEWGVVSQAFQDEFNRLKGSGALNDPQVNTIVTSLVDNVMSMADKLESNSMTTVLYGNSKPSELNSIVASQTTNGDAAQICTTGNGSDSGMHCQ